MVIMSNETILVVDDEREIADWTAERDGYYAYVVRACVPYAAVCPDCTGACGNADDGVTIRVTVGDNRVCDSAGDFYKVHGTQ